jgi:fumarate reductase subunit D
VILRPLFLNGDFSNLGKLESTRSVEVFTGLVYTVTGPTRIGGFMFFSWLGFIGLVCLYRAARISFPDADLRRYRLLLFLLPTNWFWPSSIGKDALMLFALGVAILGAARVLAGKPSGLVPFAAGAWATAIIRPHLTLILAIAFGVGAVVRLFRRQAHGDVRIGLVRRFAGVVVVALSLLLIVPVVEKRFGLSELNPDSAESFSTEVARRTSQGGSQFDAPTANSPQGYAIAVVTVLFRPFPSEATDLGSLIASAETAFLLILVFRYRRDVLTNLRRVPSSPYLALSLSYVLVFCYAFSSIVNFGILGRQRVQVLPLLLLFIAVHDGEEQAGDTPVRRARGRLGPGRALRVPEPSGEPEAAM